MSKRAEMAAKGRLLSGRAIPPGMRGVLYGTVGSSKTALIEGFIAALYERTGKPVLYFDEEEGRLVFGDLLVPGQHYDVMLPGKNAGSDSWDIAEALSGGEYSAYIHDTISGFSRRVLREIAAQNLTDNKATERPRYVSGGKMVTAPIPADYGLAAGVLETHLIRCSAAINNGTHLILISHENDISRKDSQGDLRTILTGPEFVGEWMTRNASKVFTWILRTSMKRDGMNPPKRMLSGVGDGVIMAKDRLDALPPEGLDWRVERRKDEPLDAWKLRRTERGKEIWDGLLNSWETAQRMAPAGIQQVDSEPEATVEAAPAPAPAANGTIKRTIVRKENK